jgi:ABC-type nickel/cobalt efflux system permease component RcnA
MIMPSNASSTALEGILFLYISNGVKTLLLLGCAVLIILAGTLLTIWLARRKKKRRKHRHHPHRWQLPPDSEQESKHSHRRRHRERPMNPTVASGGELPKPRPNDPASGSDRPAGSN